MLELLILALLSPTAQGFLEQSESSYQLPKIEVLDPSRIPQKKNKKVTPVLLDDPATAILAMDLDSSKILLSSHSTRSQPIASLTKLMTALVILENHELDEVVTTPLEATKINSSTIDIYQYEQLNVGTLLEAILIGSANDAAVALAIFHSGSEAEFVREMNERAKQLDLDSAKFYNSTGLDVLEPREEDDPKDTEPEILANLMSAQDVARLARIVLQYDFVREAIAQPHFYGTSVDEEFFHEKPSTNQLLGTFLNLKGMKTGYTYMAGECFIALGETEMGNEVMTIILGSSDRFGETKKLLSWIYDSFEWR
ncbi:hypothetical protein K9M59_00380 [Candidatus Gracilibacteria bacterium]|nr:hypothetical protein [Candidatus Gracilibacteria bacterium]MCF7819037.1 hypothetical protein [Candidatus Gracilibacteria bacterium]